jgi:hypothetical protein
LYETILAKDHIDEKFARSLAPRARHCALKARAAGITRRTKEQKVQTPDCKLVSSCTLISSPWLFLLAMLN